MPITTAFIYNKSKEYGAYHGTHSDIYSHTLKAQYTTGVGRYRTVDVTATAQEDYAPSEGTLIFEPGEVTKTITVQVRDHDDTQPAERFLVTLYNPKGLEIARVDGVCDLPAGSSG